MSTEFRRECDGWPGHAEVLVSAVSAPALWAPRWPQRNTGHKPPSAPSPASAMLLSREGLQAGVRLGYAGWEAAAYTCLSREAAKRLHQQTKLRFGRETRMRRQVGFRWLAAGGLLFGASMATAQTEVQWWHAMTGANNDVIVKLAEDFNASQKD